MKMKRFECFYYTFDCPRFVIVEGSAVGRHDLTATVVAVGTVVVDVVVFVVVGTVVVVVVVGTVDEDRASYAVEMNRCELQV